MMRMIERRSSITFIMLILSKQLYQFVSSKHAIQSGADR